MTKNQIFLGILGAAILIAGIAGTLSNEEYDTVSVETSSRSSGQTITFKGKEYACDSETGELVLEHEDGKTTIVTCN